MKTPQTEAAVFVIRIWREWSLSGSRWYGRIEHVRTTQTRTIQQMEQIGEFVNDCGFGDGREGDSWSSLSDELHD